MLFNNAGVYYPGNVEVTTVDDWKRAADVNFTSVFLAAKYVVPHLKKTKGSIISTASAAGIIGFPDAASYAATKGGVISLTKAIAVDYAKNGVRAAICPGTGETGMTKGLLEVGEPRLDPVRGGRSRLAHRTGKPNPRRCGP